MNFLGDFLEKFKNIRDPKKDRECVSEVVTEVLGVPVSEKEIQIKDKEIILSLSPILKNEVFLRKNEILKKLQEKFPTLPVTHIR